MHRTDGISGPVYREEVIHGDRNPISFRFKYLFSKDPCEKCLVRPACNSRCEPKYAYWDQRHSVNELKQQFKWRLTEPIIAASIIFLVFLTIIKILKG